MMNLEAYDTINGIEVHRDHDNSVVFYLLPKDVIYRTDAKGHPIFLFVKYRFPVDRPDGKKGGGFVIFDAAWFVPKDLKQSVRDELQTRINKEFQNRGQPPPPVQIADIPWYDGTATLQIIRGDGTLVDNVLNPGRPGLYGDMVTSFAVEFSPEGATLFEQTLQGAGGTIQVIYNLTTRVALPDVIIDGYFYSDKFYSFYQQITKNDSIWSDDTYQETVRESFYNSDSQNLTIHDESIQDPKIKQQLEDWAHQEFDDRVKGVISTAIDPQKDRGAVDDADQTTRSTAISKVSSFTMHYEQGVVIDWKISPPGTLQNITNMVDADGKPILFKDYERLVDLNDPFFKQIRAVVQANAPFDTLPIFSVDVHFTYPGADPVDASLHSPNDLAKFDTYIENDSWKYKYSYVVNYKNEARTLAVNDVETDRQHVTINVGDMGFLDVDVKAGSIDWTKMSQIQVNMQYQDQANGVDLVEDEFVLDTNNREHRFQKLIFVPVTQPYTYQVKYFMTDGKTFTAPAKQDRTFDLFIDSPFVLALTPVRTGGDLDNLINTIFLDLTYTDAANDYVVTRSIALNKATAFLDWSYEVLEGATGVVTYAGTIQYKDGSNEDIPVTTASRRTIMVPPNLLQVSVLPDLLDYTKLKLVKVLLEYKDPANSLDETHDVIFHKGNTAPVTWFFTVRDPSKKTFEWQATYYLADGTTKQGTRMSQVDPNVIPDMPV